MNDTPVKSSPPRVGNGSNVSQVGDGYIDPLSQIPPVSQLMDLTQASQQQAPNDMSQPAVHSFEPAEIPASPSYGSSHKEVAPSFPRPEVMRQDSLPEIPPQVVEAGVEHSPEITQEQNLQTQITQATQDLTTQMEASSLPAAPSSTPAPAYPMSKMEAEEAIKTEKYDSGRKWNATLILKLIKEALVGKQVDPL